MGFDCCTNGLCGLFSYYLEQRDSICLTQRTLVQIRSSAILMNTKIFTVNCTEKPKINEQRSRIALFYFLSKYYESKMNEFKVFRIYHISHFRLRFLKKHDAKKFTNFKNKMHLSKRPKRPKKTSAIRQVNCTSRYLYLSICRNIHIFHVLAFTQLLFVFVQ